MTATRGRANGAGERPERWTYRAARDRLAAAQKTAKGVSLYSRLVNRPLGRRLAAAAGVAGLTPNQVTLLSAACSFGGLAALALAAPSWPLAVGVYAALVLGFALDSADGQLARLYGVANPAGEWLDHVVDCLKIVAMHAAVLVTFHRHFALPGEGWLLVPLVFQPAAVLLFFGGLLTDKLRPKPAPGAGAARPSTLRAVALLPVDYGVLCGVFLLLGSERAFRFGYAALCAAYVLYCAAFSVRWFRELSALSTASASRS
ncbi:CDP-alcohol phosphatidyltransferase family protein [Streptomyces hoynatensis]|uniref:CDP-alcohol phosphatidyltransferase family protein n=1 Tax=Streptomyces hoynatensis TaxID=1141874 RepID=A0A3A9ZBT0_9ACTN|nr:CDP-alcohol phosphatidyltransferase family protein [Streptomyces hoynatensis]RKN45902.1 CDP-alcohol phosphatidyltransferase family protein [Streptomyces hoynatensis]